MNEPIYMSAVFIAGILSFFAPCIIPLLPVYMGIMAGEEDNRLKFKMKSIEINLKRIFRTLLFVFGLSTSFIIMGFGAGFLGTVIFEGWFLTVLGVIVIILGIHQTGLVHLKFLEREKKLNLNRSRRTDMFGTYLLGLTFSFGWTPCVGPVLAAVLGVSASGGQALYGAWLMLIYSIGLAIPFLIMAVFSDILLSKVKSLNKHLGKIKVVGGFLIILMGILLMTDSMVELTIFFENLFN
jgi:cytochrome c-type biogenesis protein